MGANDPVCDAFTQYKVAVSNWVEANVQMEKKDIGKEDLKDAQKQYEQAEANLKAIYHLQRRLYQQQQAVISAAVMPVFSAPFAP